MRVPGVLIVVCVMASTATQAQEVKLGPVEAYTVVYTVSGLQSGTITQYSRNFSVEQVQVNDLTLPGGAMNTVRLITQGDTITSYDPATHRAGSMSNASYAQLAAVAAGEDGEQLVSILLRALSFAPTGVMQNYAGEACTVWESAQLSQTRCVTPDGISVRIQIGSPGAGVEQMAQSISRGDPGPEHFYRVPEGVDITPVNALNQLPGLGG